MKALIIAESQDAARELSVLGRTLADTVELVSFNEPMPGIADKNFNIVVPDGNIIDDAYATVNALVDDGQFSTILVEPTVRLVSLAGRVAAHAGTAAMTDVLSIDDGAATSLYFGGAGERTVRATGNVAVYTVGQGIADGSAAQGADEVEEVAFVLPENPVVRLGAEKLEKSDVNLAGADVVVAAGRGFADQDQLGLARDLVAKLGGELGCTRPLTEGVDWMPREAYIGVSGLMLSPKVYVACGVSGQMQHMVGCNRSGAIFAVNKDKNAPIFKQCDFGLVGDIAEVLPAVAALL